MSSQATKHWHARPARSFIVLWDFPQATKSNLSTFYRRLGELLADYGGIAHCRATRSAYIVAPPTGSDGHGAMGLAYAIGVLASVYGAGKVGEQGGVVVLPLGDVSPAEHFESLARARQRVDRLCEDRRRRRRRHRVLQREIVERRE